MSSEKPREREPGQWPSEEAQKRFNQKLEEAIQDLNRWVNPADQLCIVRSIPPTQIDPSIWFGPKEKLYYRFLTTRALERIILRKLEIFFIMLALELDGSDEPEATKK